MTIDFSYIFYVLMKMLIFIVICTLWSELLFADNSCEAKSWQNEQFKIEKFQSIQSKICYISLTPKKFSNLTYRAFQFNSLGKFLIFNSFGEGPTSTFTGARVFHFFPFSNQVDFVITESEVRVFFDEKHFFNFEKSSGSLSLNQNFEFTLDSSIQPTNNGGLEINQHPNWYLDVGFSMGKDPSSVLNKEVIVNLGNKKCKTKANQLFNTEGLLKISEKQLIEIVKNICV